MKKPGLPEGYIHVRTNGEKLVKMNGKWVKLNLDNPEIRRFLENIKNQQKPTT